MLRLWKVCFFFESSFRLKGLFFFSVVFPFLQHQIPTAPKNSLCKNPPCQHRAEGMVAWPCWWPRGQRFLWRQMGAKRRESQRNAQLDCLSDLQVLRSLMSGWIPQRDLKEEFPESRKLYSGCIVCIGLKFHLGVSTAFLICITRRLSGVLVRSAIHESSCYRH